MSSPNPVPPTIEPITGALRIVNGQRLADAAPCAATLRPPLQAARVRREERLFLLLNLTGLVSAHLYRELREVVAQTYWSAKGSTTAALRLAAAAANRHLLQVNSRSIPADQCWGSLVCAALRAEDLFIVQAGPAGACFFREGRVRCFSDGRELAPLGVGRLADTRLDHVYVASGDKLLLVSPVLARTMDEAGLIRVLARIGIEEVLEGLEQVGGGADFSALVARWPLPEESPAVRESEPSAARSKPWASLWPKATRSRPPQAPAVDAAEPRKLSWLRRRKKPPAEPEARRFPPLRTEPEPSPVAPPEPTAEPYEPYEPPPPEPMEEHVAAEQAYSLPPAVAEPYEPYEPYEPPPPEPVEERVVIERAYSPPPVVVEPDEPYEPSPKKPPREPGPSLGERMGDGARSVGHGVAAAGGMMAVGASTLARRMLPDPKRRGRRRARSVATRAARPAPQENPAVMMGLAIGIPVLLAITVILAYRTLGADARFRGLIEQAEEAVGLAQTAGSTTESSRPHWETALIHAKSAVELRPDDQVAAALQAQAQVALDSLDGIVRLQPILLHDLGPGTLPRRLVVHGQMVFVLDPAGGWVFRLTLNQAGDGVIDPGGMSIIKKDDPLQDGVVGDLVDFVWVDLAGGRQTSGLLILEQDGALVSYDPVWEGEGGTLQLQRSFLGMPPESPKVIGTYDGRLYILDTVLNQIRRYEPLGDTYPERPDHYFVIPPTKPLSEAVDMAIDGYIYLLYADGEVVKFLRGNPEAFDVRGVPGDLSQAVALAVDPNGSSGTVYVADAGNERVVALDSEGEFLAQYYAEGAFDALEALAVDEAIRRMYVISGGRVYVAPLP